MKTEIQFINHASVLICTEKCRLLSDPWYSGDAFHKGWNLLTEQTVDQVNVLLEKVTHIWISHEHPDHFSIGFFTQHANAIRDRGITILFQETNDKRVKNFLESKGFLVIELPFDRKVPISEDCQVLCIKDGFYDSALLVETHDLKILNLNDCEISTKKRAHDIKNLVGKVDVLLSQFSYAAWKGGKSNIKWRQEAAKNKIETLKLQVEVLSPKILIPFASFVYFSNVRNFYLNDSVNYPIKIYKNLKDKVNIVFMKPFDIFCDDWSQSQNNEAIEYWQEKYKTITSGTQNRYNIVSIDELQENFLNYRKRISGRNSMTFMMLAKKLSPLSFFSPVVISIDDIGKNIKFDLFSDRLTDLNSGYCSDLQMSSESFNFILKNPFGFDTLTVNGCFEEVSSGGFVRAAKTFAIENYNNLGLSFSWKILFQIKLILLFIKRLRNISTNYL